jgi:flagellin
MSVINTNVSATLAANAILRNDRAMGTAMERLSTGLRINSAKDDARRACDFYSHESRGKRP